MAEHPLPATPFDPPDGFDGLTPLFPLPNVVLFPRVHLPLHIFELRYRQMVADAMGSDRLITMVLLKPGYENDYEGCPPIYQVGCLGRIVRHWPLPDGRSNLILEGLCRVRIDAETASERLYRVAQVSILEDSHPPGGSTAAREWSSRILKSLSDIDAIARIPGIAVEQIATTHPMPLGQLCDIACHHLDVDFAVRQELLEELNVGRRAERLLAWLEALFQIVQQRASSSARPGDFSLN